MKKIYWRLKIDAQDGSVSWNIGWLIGHPADGLIEIASDESSLSGVVLSRTEIEWKAAL